MTHAPEGPPSLAPFLARVLAGGRLSQDDAATAFGVIMTGAASAVQVAALLAALRVRGETPDELAGAIRALRAVMIPVAASDAAGLVDTCGTGGGDFTTFNISTAAALLAAGAGVRVAKHGNRSFTSRCGSADVLEALGIPIELPPHAMAEVLDRAGIVFMFAPLLHPAMRQVAPVRRELGVPTIMNLLGPLVNPAGARRQVVGVADAARLDLVAGALRALGHERAMVVHGSPGMDELSPLGATEIVHVSEGGELRRERFDARTELGWNGLGTDGLAGGTPDENARTVLGVLDGTLRGPARAAVLLNAAAALVVAGAAADLKTGVGVAESALDRGAGLAALDRLRSASTEAASRHRA